MHHLCNFETLSRLQTRDASCGLIRESQCGLVKSAMQEFMTWAGSQWGLIRVQWGRGVRFRTIFRIKLHDITSCIIKTRPQWPVSLGSHGLQPRWWDDPAGRKWDRLDSGDRARTGGSRWGATWTTEKMWCLRTNVDSEVTTEGCRDNQLSSGGGIGVLWWS